MLKTLNIIGCTCQSNNILHHHSQSISRVNDSPIIQAEYLIIHPVIITIRPTSSSFCNFGRDRHGRGTDHRSPFQATLIFVVWQNNNIIGWIKCHRIEAERGAKIHIIRGMNTSNTSTMLPRHSCRGGVQYNLGKGACENGGIVC